MQNRSVGTMALGWAKFFDSINRDIGDALMKRLMTQDSSVQANNYVSAEAVLVVKQDTDSKLARKQQQ